MVNDWIDLGGLVLPNGLQTPTGFLTVSSHDGVEAVFTLTGGILTIRDKGALSRDDDISIMNTVPELYNISAGQFNGDITVEELPGVRFSFTNNTLTNIIC